MLVYPHINPVALQLGPLAIHWYGLMYMAGFLTFIWLGRKRLVALGLQQINNKTLDDLLFYGVLGVILGGRLGEVLFYNPGYYFSNPLKILAVWEGGMSFHGGFLGVLVAMAAFAYQHKLRWLELMDFVAPLVPPGLAFGRLGNFINGELYGRVTNMPWGMYFPLDPSHSLRHASQLYEAVFEGIVLFILLWLIREKKMFDGFLVGIYLCGYGLVRFFIEFFREPDAQLGFVLGFNTMGQVLCLLMITAGVAVLFWRKKAAKDLHRAI